MTKIFSTHPLHAGATKLLAGRGDFVVASALDFKTLASEGADATIIIVRANIPPDLFAPIGRCGQRSAMAPVSI